MNEEIEGMARDAMLDQIEAHLCPSPVLMGEEIEAFAKAVARECAEIADNTDSDSAVWRVADTIRERFGL